MTVGDFQHQNEARWREFERLVESMEKGRPNEHADQLPRRFREICVDLSLAECRMYGSHLTERLNHLVIRGYEVIYRRRRGGWQAAVALAREGFPNAVRREWKLFWLCSAMFWGPFLAMMLVAKHDIGWILAALGSEGMESMDQMYGGQAGDQIAHLRSEYGSNFMMFCFYIWNNVAIDFRIFAGGMAAGVGTLFFLLFNGVHIGAAAGYVNETGNPELFWSFVAGHSSFELLGMIVAGMAGMKLGLAILKPGRLPRVRALAESTREAMPLIYGASVMTALAAVIEGFWSAQLLPAALKYGAGIFFWLLHIAYFLLAGRRTHAA